uniref:NAD(P)-binding protein n=1 Tax=Caenorhabditis tropicalis TaxID=1561998 RepID=A0A1I7T461_9PELO
MTSSLSSTRLLLPFLRPSKWAVPVRCFKTAPATSFVSQDSENRRSAAMPRVLITGGTDGIGREAALKLAAENHEITISGRDSKKAKDVIELCQSKFNNTPRFIQTDLSLENEVIKFANQVADEQYDICILNAGVMNPKPGRTSENREATLMTNLISSYMIAHKILDKRNDEKRPLHFVFSTSILVKFHNATPLGLRFFNPQKVSDWQKSLVPSDVSGAGKYAISKIGLATLSSSISLANLPNVTSTSVHPGTVYTNIMSNLPSRQQFYIKLARPFITSLPDAGANLVLAAKNPLPAGMFYQTNKATKLPDFVYSESSIAAFEEVFEQFKIQN